MDIETQKKLVEAIINPNKKEIKPYTTKATVSSVSDGIIYVKLPGSENSTPIKSSSVSVNPGDVVDISVSHDDSHITGNRSDVAAPESTTKQISKALEATRLEMDNTFDLFNNEIKMLNNNVDMQNNEIKMQNNTIEQINNTIEQQNNKITEIGDDITSIDNTIVSQNNKITEIGNTVNSQNNKITEIGNTVNSQNNTITEIGNTVDSQNNTITELDNTVIEIGNTVNSQGNTITEIGNTVNSQGNDITELNNTVNSQGNTITQINNSINQQNTEIETLDSNIKIINSAFIIQNGKLTGLSEIVTNILNAGYVTTDLLNADVAWIENGKIKEGAIGTVEIADESVTTAKIKDLSADVITTGTLKTECLILTTDEVDPETGEKKVALITALNAKVNSGEGNILDGAVIADETIEAAKITVVDLNAFGATIGNFHIGTSSMYNGKESLKDPTNGVYFGTDGIALGQGSLLGMTDDSPFRVESDGDFHLGAKDGNYINFNAFTGALDINVSSLKIESSNVVDRLNNIDENAIVSQIVEYYPSTSPTSLTGGSWSTSQPTWSEGIYIWSRTKNTNGKGDSSYTTPVCITGNTGAQGPQGEQGVQGEKGDKGDTGATGVGVKSSDVTYQSSTSGTTVPTGTWSPSVPSVSAGSYLWTKTVITYTNNTTTTSYSVGKMGANGTNGTNGTNGKDGADGSDGRGIKSTVVTYQAWSNGTSTPTGTWESSPPATTADKPYLWSKTVLTYTDNTTSTTYSVGSTPEGIEIGGRNLARKTSSEWSDWITPMANTVNVCHVACYAYLPDNKEEGDKYAVSIEIEFSGVTAGTGGTFKFFSQGAVDNTWNIANVWSYGNPVIITSVPDDGVYKFSAVNSLHSTAVDASRFDIGFRADYWGSGKYRYRIIKVEKGNKATDWTPAPEDVEASVNAKLESYATLEVTNNKISTAVTETKTYADGKASDAVSTAKSYTDQTAKSITSTVEGIDGRMTQMEQNADGFTWTIDKTAIVSSVNEYYKSTSPTSLSGGSWSTSQPTWSEGTYIWMRTKNTNGKGVSSYTTPACITGNTGAQGVKGDDGEDANQVVHYVNGNGNPNMYIEFADIAISGTYINTPISFRIVSRGYEASDVQLCFHSDNTTDPGLYYFRSNGNVPLWIHKTGTSTWRIITKKNEPWGWFIINNYHNPVGASVTWVGVHLESVPDGSPSLFSSDKLQEGREAAEAAKVATNYMDFGVYDNGLTIGNLTGSSVGRNVFIDSDSVDIRNGKNVLASYGENIILRHDGKDAFTIKDSEFIATAISEGRYIESANSASISKTLIVGRTYVWLNTTYNKYITFICFHNYVELPIGSKITIVELTLDPDNAGIIWQKSSTDITIGSYCSECDKSAAIDMVLKGSVLIDNAGDVSGLVDGVPPFAIGRISGKHIEMDSDEIAAKDDGTTPSHLYLNMDGGNVSINNNCMRSILFQNGIIYGKNAVGAEWVNVLECTGDVVGDTALGRGGYLNNRGSTNIYGNNLALTSNNDITTNCGVILPNGNGIHGKNTSGTTRHNFQPCNKDNNCLVGYGSYAASEGATNIYGNQLNFYTKTYLNSTRPLKILWSGASYMTASQTATLSETVSTQLNGIVLVWSKYSGGAQNYEWNCFFVPKQHVARHSGAGYVMYCGGVWPSYKYVYINNGSIVGNDTNSNSAAGAMGSTVDNTNHCLRYVYGV